MKIQSTLRLLLLTGFGIVTTVSAQSANPYARPQSTPNVSTPAKGNAMNDLTAFATGGAKVFESVRGDLTGEGRSDVLLVLDPPQTSTEKLGQGPSRHVVLLLRDEAGQLHRASANILIVPCSLCGGVAGDPYAYSRIGKGQFTIVIGGGSRERWTDEYTFTYVGAKKDWFISSAVRKVFDTDTDKEKHVDLTAKELGTVSFADFDPGKLPEVALP
ncbi:hypothetical protein [Luteibacter sp. dw_328]|uniref:hypothetical protein n=1 Tax=Luteibacter sp. dw_328 TaxID=2719796 RepID=UPI00210535A7|nr:hypothetical protein [Luteibacter sp. dw_328]